MKVPTSCRGATLVVWSATVWSATVGWIGSAAANDDLQRRASWQAPTVDQVQQQVTNWLSALPIDDEVRQSAVDLWNQPLDEDGPSILARTIATLQHVDSEADRIIRRCQRPTSLGTLPDTSWLEDDSRSEFWRDNLRLYVGKWLALNQMYNEALQMLQPLEPEDVVDPASLLFYRAAAHYRLRNKDSGLETLDRLLENTAVLPCRFATLAELMRADLKQLRTDSLGEVARIMDSVGVRLGLGRAGKRVRQEEDEVIDKLDKMIEQLEQQRQQQMAQSQGPAQGNQSSSPASDSSLPGGQASGDVDPKQLGRETDWGNLPAKEREEALQQLGKDFPSHYREVIEEYFRKLARENTPPE